MHDVMTCPYVGEYEQLASENTALRAALERLEWANAHMEHDGEIWHSCPACGNDKRCGHTARSCWLRAVLSPKPSEAR